MVSRARFIEEDRRRCDGYVPHRARLARLCPEKDMAQGGACPRLTTRSVELETSSRWLRPSNRPQSTGIVQDVEIGLMAADGCCLIGVGQT